MIRLSLAERYPTAVVTVAYWVRPDAETTFTRAPIPPRFDRNPSDDSNPEPVLTVAAVVAKDDRRLPDVAHDRVDVAVVVEIAERGAAARPVLLEHVAREHADEAPGLVAQQQWRLQVAQVGRRLFDRVHHVPLRDEDVLPPVVVVVEEPCAPAREGERGPADAAGVGSIAEAPVPVVAEQPVALVRQIGDEHIGPAVVVVIAEVDTHAGERLPILVQRDAREQPLFGEGALASVVEQEAREGVVGHVDVDPAIVIVIGEGDAETLARRARDARLHRDVG